MPVYKKKVKAYNNLKFIYRKGQTGLEEKKILIRSPTKIYINIVFVLGRQNAALT